MQGMRPGSVRAESRIIALLFLHNLDQEGNRIQGRQLYLHHPFIFAVFGSSIYCEGEGVTMKCEDSFARLIAWTAVIVSDVGIIYKFEIRVKTLDRIIFDGYAYIGVISAEN